MNELSEPTLWTIVLTLAAVVGWGGRYVIKKLQDCEEDREVLHKKTAKLGVCYAARFGEVIDLDDLP
jgi:hypothetical protein